MIAYCFELDVIMPDRYGWRFSSEESFSKQIDGVRDPQSLNKIYWTDMARNVEAYSTMTFWRGLELLKPAIRSLNIREIITPPCDFEIRRIERQLSQSWTRYCGAWDGQQQFLGTVLR